MKSNVADGNDVALEAYKLSKCNKVLIGRINLVHDLRNVTVISRIFENYFGEISQIYINYSLPGGI